MNRENVIGKKGKYQMVVVFSGYNPRAVISFLRTLDNDNISYLIIASGESDSILQTEYKSKVIYNRKIKALNTEEILQSIDMVRTHCAMDEPILIAPSTESLNRYLLENRDLFESRGCIIPLVDKSLYEELSDKSKFEQLCRKNSILIPPEINLSKGYTQPIVAKPKQYYSSDNCIYCPEFLLSQTDYNNFIKNHKMEDFSFQKFLEHGNSYYLLFYFSKNGIVFTFSQENYAQQSDGKSIVAAKSSDIHLNNSVCAPYVQMLLSKHFFGLIMIEIRYYEGKYYMIEANPRFWGPSQLFCDANYNLFDCFLWDNGILNQKPEIIQTTESYYYWSGGITGNILEEGDCVWFGNGKESFLKEFPQFEMVDIYCRPDTMNIYYKEKLYNLYQNNSKHSAYQILPNCLLSLLNPDQLSTVSRFEAERMDYIVRHVHMQKKTVLDIGGNTGYFTFEALDNGAQSVDYYEGNSIHADFVKTAVDILDLNEKVTIHNDYFLFKESTKRYDICFCLNVLHHLGDDFGVEQDIENVKSRIIDCINSLSYYVDFLILQLGYNWKGDRKKCLFRQGTKEEIISFIKRSCEKYWSIQDIGIAEKNINNVVYKAKSNQNISRNDTMGEFLNRPIFIMKSKCYNSEIRRF